MRVEIAGTPRPGETPRWFQTLPYSLLKDRGIYVGYGTGFNQVSDTLVSQFPITKEKGLKATKDDSITGKEPYHVPSEEELYVFAKTNKEIRAAITGKWVLTRRAVTDKGHLGTADFYYFDENAQLDIGYGYGSDRNDVGLVILTPGLETRVLSLVAEEELVRFGLLPKLSERFLVRQDK
jgi:hypothetical protein